MDSSEEMSLVPSEMENSIANTHEVQVFIEALNKENIVHVVEAFAHLNAEQKKYCGNYLVGLESSRLIELIKKVDNTVKSDDHILLDIDCGEDNQFWNFEKWIFAMILVHSGPLLFDSVFDAIQPPEELLDWTAVNVELACMPEKFVHLLSKTTEKSREKEMVEYGVWTLVVGNRFDCLDPLLAALKSGTFLNDDMENIVIRGAFMAASFYHSNDNSHLVMRFFDHPAISAEDYAHALLSAHCFGEPGKMRFHWLLERADRQDLENLKKLPVFPSRDREFQKLVISALRNAGSYTRTKNTKPKETFHERCICS